MAQYQITVDGEVLHQLFRGDEGWLSCWRACVNQVLEAQVTEQLKAAPFERSDERVGYRNGYRDREMKTRVGTLELRVPRVRSGSFSTELFERYQRSEQALLLALMEMVINGVSTRKVRRITEELVWDKLLQVDGVRVVQSPGPHRQGMERAFAGGGSVPVCDRGCPAAQDPQRRACDPPERRIAVGVNAEGYREVLGLMIGDSESEASWSEFFTWLKQRGLTGVDLVVSDHHGGLVNAIRRHFQGASWQRCQVHLMRNVLDAAPAHCQHSLKAKIRLMFNAPDMETARRLLDDILSEYGSRAPKAVACLEAGFEDAMAVMALPERYRRRLRSTNGLERLNREVRRRERVIGIFPNVASALRLLGALLMEQDEEWTTGRCYLRMDEYWQWKKAKDEASGEKTTSEGDQAA